MTITGIRNGLFTLLTASGPYGATEISACSFDCLEGTTGCAVTFFPEGTSEIEPLTFGANHIMALARHWRIGGTVWIRDIGTPQAVLGGIWQAYDDLYATIAKDNTLGGACDNAFLLSITQRLDQYIDAGGQVWKPVDFVIQADEL